MRRYIRVVAAILLVAISAESSLLAVGSKNAAYFGGTVAVFGSPKDPVEGALDTANEAALILTPKDKRFAGKALSIPYAKVIDLEYGQKAGRRVGAAVGTTILLGPIGLLSLFFEEAEALSDDRLQGRDRQGSSGCDRTGQGHRAHYAGDRSDPFGQRDRISGR